MKFCMLHLNLFSDGISCLHIYCKLMMNSYLEEL